MPSELASTSRPLTLIVENHDDTREMYALRLSYEGMSVLKADNDKHALEMARSFLPDVITTDLRLKDFSGMTLCERLKDHAATKDIPVIAVTGHGMPHEVTSALAAGCVSVLVKPCPPDTLLAEIRRVLSLSHTPSGTEHA